MMHKSSANNKFIGILFLVLVLISSSAQAMVTKAKQAYMFNAQTGAVLFEFNADQLMPPSSMTKIMTVYLLFEHIKNGEVNLDDEFPVSTLAWRKGGSKMFVEVGSHVRVEDLLRGIIVQSGNDACIVVAEALAGGEDVFAVEMSRKAKELGATNTTFKNSTGWPDPLHLSTAKDLAVITQRLMDTFPDLYKAYFSQPDFTYNKIFQKNRTLTPGLIKIGADGVKTGSTDAGGYGMVASAVQNGQRITLVINGLKTAAERSLEAENLLSWGFRNFVTPVLFKKGEEVISANVWLGDKTKVPLVLDNDLMVTMPRGSMKNMKVEAVFDEPIDVSRIGQVVGKVIVTIPDREPIETPLRAVGDVKSAGIYSRLKAALHYLAWGHNEQP